tara:strand:+ start:1647 stop:2159 length:513 start_codon:yes stop_codon:yes gene_type:complete
MPDDLESFRELRSRLEVESMEDLEGSLQEGELSLNYPLGVLLEILRYSSGDVIRTGPEYFDNEDFDPWVKKMREQYGFDLDSPASYFQGAGLNIGTFSGFVDEWHQIRGEREWNPSWAPKTLNPQMELYCKDHSPQKVLRELGLEGRGLFYPGDGFTLAEGLRFSYERET